MKMIYLTLLHQNARMTSGDAQDSRRAFMDSFRDRNQSKDEYATEFRVIDLYDHWGKKWSNGGCWFKDDQK